MRSGVPNWLAILRISPIIAYVCSLVLVALRDARRSDRYATQAANSFVVSDFTNLSASIRHGSRKLVTTIWEG